LIFSLVNPEFLPGIDPENPGFYASYAFGRTTPRRLTLHAFCPKILHWTADADMSVRNAAPPHKFALEEPP